LSDRSATIIITCQESRSQLKNKKLALVRLQTLIHETLLPEIPRIPTTPPGEVKEKRMAVKKKTGEIKQFRGNLRNKDIE